jgi:hypothetical protein
MHFDGQARLDADGLPSFSLAAFGGESVTRPPTA